MVFPHSQFVLADAFCKRELSAGSVTVMNLVGISFFHSQFPGLMKQASGFGVFLLACLLVLLESKVTAYTQT